MRIPVPSAWLPGDVGVVQTVLCILTMAGLLPDRPRISICVSVWGCVHAYTCVHVVNTTCRVGLTGGGQYEMVRGGSLDKTLNARPARPLEGAGGQQGGWCREAHPHGGRQHGAHWAGRPGSVLGTLCWVSPPGVTEAPSLPTLIFLLLPYSAC